MLLSKKKYIEDMLDSLVGGKNLTGIRDLVDLSVEQYIDKHTTAVANNWLEDTPENIKNNILANALEENILTAFGKDMIKYIKLSDAYKEALMKKQK